MRQMEDKMKQIKLGVFFCVRRISFSVGIIRRISTTKMEICPTDGQSFDATFNKYDWLFCGTSPDSVIITVVTHSNWIALEVRGIPSTSRSRTRCYDYKPKRWPNWLLKSTRLGQIETVVVLLGFSGVSEWRRWLFQPVASTGTRNMFRLPRVPVATVRSNSELPNWCNVVFSRSPWDCSASSPRWTNVPLLRVGKRDLENKLWW